jgi:acetyltransferase-like isoleucine patch superfamily enzyme
MALQLNWTHSATDVTYNNAYATITDVTYIKDATTGDYRVMATVQIYKNAVAYAAGKRPVTRTKYSKAVTIQPTDTLAGYRNTICQVYEYMKLESPWDTATNV